MAEPVKFEIARKGQVWVLTRDGRHVADYSHVDRATHEAVGLARGLSDAGEPARVFVEAAEGKVIEVDVEPPRDRPPPADDGMDRSRT